MTQIVNDIRQDQLLANDITIILTNAIGYTVILIVIVFVANNYQSLIMRSDLDKGLMVEKLGEFSSNQLCALKNKYVHTMKLQQKLDKREKKSGFLH